MIKWMNEQMDKWTNGLTNDKIKHKWKNKKTKKQRIENRNQTRVRKNYDEAKWQDLRLLHQRGLDLFMLM